MGYSWALCFRSKITMALTIEQWMLVIATITMLIGLAQLLIAFKTLRTTRRADKRSWNIFRAILEPRRVHFFIYLILGLYTAFRFRQVAGDPPSKEEVLVLAMGLSISACGMAIFGLARMLVNLKLQMLKLEEDAQATDSSDSK